MGEKGGAMTKRTARRLTNGLLGALGGLLGGFGFALVVSHTEGVTTEAFAGISAVAIAVGAVLGLLDPPKVLRWVLALLMLLWPALTITQFTGLASAQAVCEVTMGFPGERPFDPTRSTPEDPVVFDVREADELQFRIAARELAGGRMRVEIAESDPPLPIGIDPHEAPVTGPIVAGALLGSPRGIDEVVIGARDRIGIGPVPFGLARVDGRVFDNGNTFCELSIWLRILSDPLQTTAGRAGIALHLLGTVGMAGALLRRTALPLPAPVAPIPAAPVGVSNGRIRAKMYDEAGNPVPPTEPLVAGRQYRLELTLDFAQREREEDARAVVTSRDVDVRGTIRPEIKIGAGPFALAVPLTPRRAGQAKVDVDVVQAGSLVQSERFRLDVVDRAERGNGTALRQTSHTTFQGAEPGTGPPPRPRHATVVLYRDPVDQTVDLRVLDYHGQMLFTYDTPAQPDTVDGAAAGVRQVLAGKLMGADGFGAAIAAAPELLDEWLPALAQAGRALVMELLPAPPGAPPDQAGGVAAAVPPNGLVQINQNLAGLGHATIPWNFAYDRRFLPGPGARACRTFATHGLDACPEATADPAVACPTGFWGYRYVLEQPPTWVHKALPPPLLRPVAHNGKVVVNFNVDPSFTRWQDHLDSLGKAADLEVLTARSAAEVMSVWAADQARLDLVYFYAHHRTEGSPALAIGEQLIDRVFLDGAGARWDGHPLVLLNGCGTGAAAVATYAPIIDDFRARGACGVVGTECTVSELLAERVARDFLTLALAGHEIGPALLAARRALLTEHFNPGGLAWALYAVSDVTMTEAS